MPSGFIALAYRACKRSAPSPRPARPRVGAHVSLGSTEGESRPRRDGTVQRPPKLHRVVGPEEVQVDPRFVAAPNGDLVSAAGQGDDERPLRTGHFPEPA